jgi:hypothetical protein
MDRITMIRPDFAKWSQSAEDLRRLSVEAQHVRSRERFQALYVIGSEQANATQWAHAIGRKDQTVQGWVHKYNAQGPESLIYQRSGSNSPLLANARKAR